jgi:hypothetical protein
VAVDGPGGIEIEYREREELGGEALDTTDVQSAFGRTMRYFVESDMDAALETQRLREPVPGYPGLTYIEDAAKELNVSVRTLRRLLKARDPEARPVKKRGKSKDGRGLKRAYVPAEFVTETQAKRKSRPTPMDRMTVEEAAACLGIQVTSVRNLICRGKLKAETGEKTVNAKPRKGAPTACATGARPSCCPAKKWSNTSSGVTPPGCRAGRARRQPAATAPPSLPLGPRISCCGWPACLTNYLTPASVPGVPLAWINRGP